MTWEPLQVKDLSLAIQFIGEREWVCEHLVSRLLKKQKTTTLSPDSLWVRYENGKPTGLLFLSKQGLLLPYLPFLEERRFVVPEDFDLLKKILPKTTNRIYSIVGKLLYVQAMEELLRFDGGSCVDYHLMTRIKSEPLPPVPLIPRFQVKKATLGDVECILPLQILYEKEEVLIQPDLMDPEKTRKDLNLSLQEQIILVGVYEGNAVSKVGTNARGIFYDQIGGVFTDPNHRNRHFARALLIRLLHLIHGEGKNACLFVKIHNQVAIHLYEELGFQIQEAFRIHYT